MNRVAEKSNESPTTTVDERFTLSRWSRLKRGAGAVPAVATDEGPLSPKPSLDAAPGSAASAAASGPTAAAGDLQLPPLSSISLNADFTPFMQAKVPAALRQQALKALFREPHFNAMDGLDTYIDDYTQFEPIAPEVLEKLSAWQAIKNPPQMVVADGGYAVDVTSDEGRAILAARAARDAEDNPQEDSAAEAAADSPDTPPPPALHARYGTRVGDFSAATAADPEPALTDPVPDSVTPVPALAGSTGAASDKPPAL